MKYSLYSELRMLFGDSCDLSEIDCMLLQDALDLKPSKEREKNYIDKQTKNKQKVRIFSEGHYTLVEVKEESFNSGWNCASLVVTPDNKSFSGNISSFEDGVYFFEMPREGQLSVRHYDAETYHFYISVKKDNSTPEDAKNVFRLAGIEPDEDVTVDAKSVVGKFSAFVKDPMSFCREVISWDKKEAQK